MDYSIRVAERKDIAFLSKARIDFLKMLGYSISQDEYNDILNKLTKQIEGKLDKTLICVLAEYNNDIIGTAYMTIDERLYHPETPNGKVGNIVNVYTDERFRGNGIAYSTVEKLMDLSKEYGVEKITLDATKMGERVYRKLGFSSEEDPILPTAMHYLVKYN